MNDEDRTKLRVETYGRALTLSDHDLGEEWVALQVNMDRACARSHEMRRLDINDPDRRANTTANISTRIQLEAVESVAAIRWLRERGFYDRVE